MNTFKVNGFVILACKVLTIQRQWIIKCRQYRVEVCLQAQSNQSQFLTSLHPYKLTYRSVRILSVSFRG